VAVWELLLGNHWKEHLPNEAGEQAKFQDRGNKTNPPPKE